MASDATNDINKLITAALDGKYGYDQAASNATDPSLKSLFQDYSRQRETFANELQQQVRAMGGTPTDHGSVTAGLHRNWIGLKDKLTSGDKGILGECVRGEESAVKQYQEVLGDDDVPAAAKTVLARQHGEIEQALAKMNQLHSTAS